MLRESLRRRALGAHAVADTPTADALAHMPRFYVSKLPVASPMVQPKRHTRTIRRTHPTGALLPVSQPFHLALQGVVIICILIFAGGCQPVQQVEGTPASPNNLPVATATVASTATTAAPPATDASAALEASSVATAPATSPAPRTSTDDAQATIEALAPHLPAPVRLTIANAALDVIMDVTVEAMGWEVVGTGGEAPTRWLLPANAAGWHANSAHPGEAGNVIISGRQLGADAVFAPLALGAVQVGQQIVVTDDAGGAHTYTIREISQPLPLVGADATTDAAVAAYMAASSTPILTLITGWPDFTTTHRIFVVATLDQ